MKTQMSKTKEGKRTLNNFKQRIWVYQSLQGKGDARMPIKNKRLKLHKQLSLRSPQ